MEETEHEFRMTYSALNNHYLVIKMISRYFAFHVRDMRKYIDFYRQYGVPLNTFLTALATLAEGILLTTIIDLVTLQKYITTIQDELIKNTNYEAVFKNIYEFHTHRLVAFTNIAGMLLLQLLLLIILKVQVPMLLYSIDTVPVLMDTETYQELSR